MRHVYVLLVCMLLMMACKREEPSMETVRINAEILSMSSMDVSICITHNGSNRDKYYGLLTTDSIVNPKDYVNHYIDSIGSDAVLENAWYQRKRVENIHHLIPFVNYKFVAFMLDDKGKLRGEPTTIAVQTTSNIAFELNPNWQLVWKGEVLYKKIYQTCVNGCVLDDTRDPFYACLISAAQYDACGSIDRVIYWLISEAVYNMEDGANWFDNNMISRVSVNSYYYRSPGYYYALMIGVNADGTPTGKYAISDKQQIDEYPMVEEYQNMIGIWHLVDAQGVEDTIKIEKKRINRSLSIAGWSGRKWPVLVQYDPTYKMHFTINSQCVAQTIRISANREADYYSDVYLRAWYVDSNGAVQRTTETTELAKIVVTDNDHYIIDKAFYYTNMEETTYGLKYYIVNPSDQILALNNSTYTFPINLTRL